MRVRALVNDCGSNNCATSTKGTDSSVLDSKGQCCPDSLSIRSKDFSAKPAKVNSVKRKQFKGPVLCKIHVF